MKNKGFTLIELLIVISIMGILFNIIFSSLGESKDKANTAAAKKQLSSFRSTAELTYIGNYTDLCIGSDYTDLTSQLTIKKGSISTCEDGVSDYRITATLADGSGFCVNSNGSSRSTSLIPAEAYPSPICGLDELVDSIGQTYWVGHFAYEDIQPNICSYNCVDDPNNGNSSTVTVYPVEYCYDVPWIGTPACDPNPDDEDRQWIEASGSPNQCSWICSNYRELVFGSHTTYPLSECSHLSFPGPSC